MGFVVSINSNGTMINEVPVYMYYCLPDKSAVDKLKGVLEEEVYGTTTNNEVFI